MSENPLTSVPVPEGYKATPVMAYTQTQFIWGEVISVEAIRVSTWLRTQAVPKFIRFLDAQVLNFGTGGNMKPLHYRDFFLPSAHVLAFHLKPPLQDPLDYDPNEPMRKMEPVTALVGNFRFDGYLRMSTQTNLERFLEVAKEAFVSMYDIQISNLALPALAGLRTPFCLLKMEGVSFSARIVETAP